MMHVHTLAEEVTIAVSGKKKKTKKERKKERKKEKTMIAEGKLEMFERAL